MLRFAKKVVLSITFCLLSHLTVLGAQASVSPATIPDAGDEVLQFNAEGHALGFAPGAIYLATGSHALRVEFVDASDVKPAVDGDAAVADGESAPPGRVSYSGLWEGVSLAYDGARNGILRSTWTVAPGADPGRIRLRYNVPVALESDGSLWLTFANGRMSESAPVAWQEVGGRRAPVRVAFRVIDEDEVGFEIGAFDPGRTLWIDPTLKWNTFLGSSSGDNGYKIAVDGNGNVYVTGDSSATWGSPKRAFSGLNGTSNAFVAKLNSSGALQWNTFLGSSSGDSSRFIAVDGSGNTYVTGYSLGTWGSPKRTFSGSKDAFAAKLDSAGVLQWNTFLGSSDSDDGEAIASDGSGNLFVTGSSAATWGSPGRPFSGGSDGFVSKLNSAGILQWNTFLGSSGGEDYGFGIVVDGSLIYVTGESYATWGAPVRAFSGTDGRNNAFVAKLDGAGALQWNTFLGSSDGENGLAIAVGGGNVYLTGGSYATWGSPLRAFSGSVDAFVAKLDGAGALLWNTFLGSSSADNGWAVALDGSGNAYVAGQSSVTWGSPSPAFSGSVDAFMAKLNSAGALQWNAFVGSSGYDDGLGLAVDASGSLYVTGRSMNTWGSPVRAFSGSSGMSNAFAAKLTNGWRAGEANLGGGWKWSKWLGYYNMNYDPWVYHQQHGFIYPFEDPSGGVYFWDTKMQNFWWTSNTIYPSIYRFGTNPGWLWYQKDSSGPRWFFNWSTMKWVSMP